MAAALVLISRTAQFPDTHDKAYEELVKEYGPTLDQAEYQTLLKAKSVYIEELGGEGWSRDRVHWAEIMADESKRQFVFLVDAIDRIEEEIQFGYGFAFEKEPTETLKEQLRSCTPQEAARILLIVQTKELPLSSPGICEVMESDPLLLLIGERKRIEQFVEPSPQGTILPSDTRAIGVHGKHFDSASTDQSRHVPIDIHNATNDGLPSSIGAVCGIASK